ncbi:SufE family protein [Raoultibacter massiliensis]|uniref:SufE family protein n=1 Tax=Raoultibacter massiliensis TaxID=1852371 RepID=UPI003A8FC4E5
METAAEAQQRLIDDFAEFSDDPFSLYEYLLGFAADLPVMPDEEKKRARLVEGCQSQVWLNAHRGADGNLAIALDSDTLIVRGVLHAIVQIYSGRPDDEIRTTDFTFLEQTELADLFSAERQSGIEAVMRDIRKAVAEV